MSFGSLGSLVTKGLDAVFGGDDKQNSSSSSTNENYVDLPKTNLNDFLKKFSAPEGKYIETIDPLQTFEVQFEIFPGPSQVKPVEEEKSDCLKKLGEGEFMDAAKSFASSALDSAVGMAKSAVGNLLNNITGGLLKTHMDNKTSVLDEKKTYLTTENKNKYSFLYYLAKASKLSEEYTNADMGEDIFNSVSNAFTSVSNSVSNFFSGEESKPETNKSEPESKKANDTLYKLYLNLSFYVQKITLPNIVVDTSLKSNSYFGSITIPGHTVNSTPLTLKMSIINTKASLHERIFYPWLREVTLPYWVYDSQPYTTATIIVDFGKHMDLQYVFTGCRPVKITSVQADQSADSKIVRDVEFLFDYVFINSKLKNYDDVKSKLMGTAGQLLDSAGTMINLSRGN